MSRDAAAELTQDHARLGRRSRAEVKALITEQFLPLGLDEERAVAAIPRLPPAAFEERHAILETLHAVIDAPGPLSPEARIRLSRINALFDAPKTAQETARA
ncbi:hypothetical protein ASD21_00345 [Caulobacter sp. Root1455]|uniref:hypothetical protein n=1 Tax=Caulobacter sp. Root1455 TaxID=1736465 RepID=UPI0006F426FC|nr:hypothetical protein [Caulobacter sp. Root1455]KQZ06129.1 hypothetical protein ASD21_00345 [Caulobacter sp. Root1455]